MFWKVAFWTPEQLPIANQGQQSILHSPALRFLFWLTHPSLPWSSILATEQVMVTVRDILLFCFSEKSFLILDLIVRTNTFPAGSVVSTFLPYPREKPNFCHTKTTNIILVTAVHWWWEQVYGLASIFLGFGLGCAHSKFGLHRPQGWKNEVIAGCSQLSWNFLSVMFVLTSPMVPLGVIFFW